MSFPEALILGITQGLTEFLPISSSAHLIVIPQLFGWSSHSLVFDTTLHLGTSLALLVYFRKDLWNMLKNFKKWWLTMFLGILPAGLLGFFLNDLFETYFRGVGFVVLFLILGSVLMFLAERSLTSDKSVTTLEEINPLKSLLIGFFQSLALFPGFSRSGSTISGGMFLGLSRENAARFSFLLSIPIIWVAGFYEFTKIPISSVSTASEPFLGVAVLSSFITGFLCIKFFMKFVSNCKLYPFVIYRLALSVSLVFLLIS